MAHANSQGVRSRHPQRAASSGGSPTGLVRMAPVRIVAAVCLLLCGLPAVTWGQPAPVRPVVPPIRGAGQLPPAAAAGAQPPAGQPGGDESLPAPRQIDEIGPRTKGLPAAARTFGAPPIPTREDLDRYQRYVIGFTDPHFSLDLIQGQSRLLHLKEAPMRIQIGDTRVFDYTVLGPPTELSLLGTQVGSTVMNMWFGDRDDPANQTVLSFIVHVLPDPDAKRRLEEVYKALQDEINKAFPDSYVCLTLVGDKLVVSGEVVDAIQATQILRILSPGRGGGPTSIAANPVLQSPGTLGTNVNLNLFNPSVIGNIPGIPEGQIRPSMSDYVIPSEPNIINLLRIPGEQQVNLKVTVAEVSRGATRAMGINWTITNNSGITPISVVTGGSNIPVLLDNGQVSLAIEALRTVDLARSLAEPNLTTLNGVPAFFFSGGEFPVPVITGATAVGLQGVSFVPFGISLQFTPIITCKDRIRLQVNATVSTRDVSLSGGGVPGLTGRTISTTVEMREGQTFAIGGLLQHSFGARTRRIPLFGDIPFGGQFFRSDSTEAGESEVVMLVTPHLVHPLEPHELPALPGSDVFEPGDLEFYLHGRLESSRAYDYRSQVMNDIHRMAAYRHCELLYFVGPHGHCDTPPQGH